MQDEFFQIKGNGWFRIVSNSMSPLIEINDRVLVKKVNPFEIPTFNLEVQHKKKRLQVVF